MISTDAATERLHRHAHETYVDIAEGNRDGMRAEKQLKEMHRGVTREEWQTTASELRQKGRSAPSQDELRTPMSTAATFGGELVTPVYLEAEFLKWRQSGRSFADFGTLERPLPDYGMTMYVPTFNAPSAVAIQSAQNSGIQETDPSTSYLSLNLSTYAGQVVLSQILIDRAGPDFAFDEAIYDSLQTALAPQIDAFFLTGALAGAGGVTYTAGEFLLFTPSHGPSDAAVFSGVVGQAKNAIRTTANVFCVPDQLWCTPARLEYMRQCADAFGRPVLVNDGYGASNAAGTGQAEPGIDGNSGFTFQGLPVYTDPNIPVTVSGSYEQALVQAHAEIRRYESTPVLRTVTQQLANDLSVEIQLYEYVAGYVRRPLAVQGISGTGLGTSVAWT